MEIVNLAELGAQVVLDAIVLWLVVKYLPSRDKAFTQEMQKLGTEMKNHTAQLNRIVNAIVLLLDDKDKGFHKMSDDIFKSHEQTPQSMSREPYEEADEP